jgi:hypothetical protein
MLVLVSLTKICFLFCCSGCIGREWQPSRSANRSSFAESWFKHKSSSPKLLGQPPQGCLRPGKVPRWARSLHGKWVGRDICFENIFLFIQWKPLNVITLGHTVNRHKRAIWDLDIWISLITLTRHKH